MTGRAKVLRFLVVGVLNTAIDFGLLFALVAISTPLLLANIISTSCALAFSFLANRSFTFGAAGQGRTASTAAKFLLVTLFGLWVLQPLVLFAGTSLLTPALSDSLALFVSKVLATVVSMTWNFLLYDRFVFRSKGVR